MGIKETQAELVAHERECAERAKAVSDKLSTLDKRLWRLEVFGGNGKYRFNSILVCYQVFMRIG